MWQMHTAYINTEGILDFLFLRTRRNLGLSICVHYRGNLGLSMGQTKRKSWTLCALQRESWTFCALEGIMDFLFVCTTEGILDFLFVCTTEGNLGLSVWVHCVRGNAGIPRL